MRLPWGKFYWDDFDRDCSPLSNEACGVWIRILCIMSRSPRPGSLLHATGHPYTDEDAARAFHLSLDGWTAIRSELLRTGVASHDKHGTLINRRMVREAKERSAERLRKAETCGKRDKSLTAHQNLPESFRQVSGEIPGEKPRSQEARSQKPEAAAIAAAVAPVAPAPATAAMRPVPEPEIDYQEVIRNQAMRMIRLHPPPQGSIPHLESALALRIHDAVNPSGVLAAIEAAHQSACQRQTAKPQRFWPNAARWVADRDDMKGQWTERRKTIDEDLF